MVIQIETTCKKSVTKVESGLNCVPFFWVGVWDNQPIKDHKDLMNCGSLTKM